MSNIIITPIGRVSYPNLLRPKQNSFNGDVLYSVDLLFPKNKNQAECVLNPLRNLIEKAVKEKWPKTPGFIQLPIKDGDGLKPKAGTPYDEAYHGCWFITLKNKIKPQVVDQNVKAIQNEEDLYGGCYGRATLSIYAYDNKGNKGVSLSLNNFQKTGDGERFSGQRTLAEEDFSAISSEADNPANYTNAQNKSIWG